jgi:hypothetical protein
MIQAALVVALLLGGMQTPPAGRPPAPVSGRQAAPVAPPRAPASRQQAVGGTASVAGVVLQSGGDPIPNVRVALARTDAPLGAFAEMIGGDHPPVEVTIPGELLAIMAKEMSNEARLADLPSEAAAQAKAMAAVDLSDILELSVSPNGAFAVVSKSVPPAITDSQGRFSFAEVPPGAYKLTFTAAGYARQDYGQRGADGKGVLLALTAGQAKQDLVMRLNPVSAINGHVFDNSLRPIAGVPVQLFSFAYNETGHQAMRQVASTQTDDRGAYRLFYLTPGRYYLSAGSQPGSSSSSYLPPELALIRGASSTSQNRIPQTYPLMYYPGTPDPKEARVIDVAPGADMDGLDLTLDAGQPRRIRGHIVDLASGRTPTAVNITLTAQRGDLAELLGGFDPTDTFDRSMPYYDAQDGSFELRGVRPGAYTLSANVINPRPARNRDLAAMSDTERQAYFEAMEAAESGQPRGRLQVTVGSTDLENMIVTITKPSAISGKMRIEDGVPPPEGKLAFARIQLIAPDTQDSPFDGSRQQASVREDTFSLANVWPGEYRVVVNGLPAGYYVKQVRFGDVDALSNLFRFNGADSGILEVVIGAGSGQLKGAVLNSENKPVGGAQVVLVPSNHARIELFRPVTADPEGKFAITGIVPGDYVLAAWEDIEPYGFFDPELLKQADEKGQSIRVGESSRETADINPLPLPERR